MFLLGTDDQGRDMFSAILYGSRVSLLVGFASVVFSIAIGVTLGLMAGYLGGRTDAFIMRIADIQLSFPAILIALLVFGVARGLIAPQYHEQVAIIVLIIAIGLSNWASYARTVRGSTLVEKNKEYVMAARVMGRSAFAIMGRHVLPNVIGPVLVIATINLALAIIAESTLSFLGVGVPPTQPSLGTLIRVGQQFLFSGEWWILLYPGARSRATRAVDQPARRLAARRAEPETAMTDPVLSVRNLRVEFPTRRGILTAIDGISFDIAPGEVLGVVGESGAGKSITGTAIIGLIEPPGRIAGGEVLLRGERIDNLPPEQMRQIRGKRIGMVFQDPLTSLNPLYRIGDQLVETIRTHSTLSESARAEEGALAARRGRHPGRRNAHRRLSAPVLRRHAPARGAGARARRRAGAGHRRRADHRARRLGAGADHRAAEAAVRPARRRRHADHPRHGRDRRDRRPRRRDVCGPHRRDRPGARRDQGRRCTPTPRG